MIKKIPDIGERVKWIDRNPSKKGERILEGTVVGYSKKFGGQVHLTNINSNSNFIVRLDQLL